MTDEIATWGAPQGGKKPKMHKRWVVVESHWSYGNPATAKIEEFDLAVYKHRGPAKRLIRALYEAQGQAVNNLSDEEWEDYTLGYWYLDKKKVMSA